MKILILLIQHHLWAIKAYCFISKTADNQQVCLKELLIKCLESMDFSGIVLKHLGEEKNKVWYSREVIPMSLQKSTHTLNENS